MAENSSSVVEFAEKILGRAKTCLLNSDYGHAFANFLMLLKVSPQLKSDIKEEFAVSLSKCNLNFYIFKKVFYIWIKGN